MVTLIEIYCVRITNNRVFKKDFYFSNKFW